MIMFLMFSIRKDVDFLYEGGFLKIDTKCFYKEFKNLLMEQCGSFLNCIKNAEDFIVKIILTKFMEQFY